MSFKKLGWSSHKIYSFKVQFSGIYYAHSVYSHLSSSKTFSSFPGSHILFSLQPLRTANLLSISMNLPILDISYKWNHTTHGIKKFFFIWLHCILVASHWVFNLHCGILDLLLWPGIEPWPPTLGPWRPSHWATREVPTWHFWFLSPSIIFLRFTHIETSYFIPSMAG